MLIVFIWDVDFYEITVATFKRVGAGGATTPYWNLARGREGGSRHPGQVTVSRGQVQSWACACVCVSNKQAASPTTWRSLRALEPCYCKPSACRLRRGSARSAWPLQPRSARDATRLWLHLLRLLLRRDDTTAPIPGTICTSGTCTARTPVSLNPEPGPRRTKESCEFFFFFFPMSRSMSTCELLHLDLSQPEAGNYDTWCQPELNQIHSASRTGVWVSFYSLRLDVFSSFFFKYLDPLLL